MCKYAANGRYFRGVVASLAAFRRVLAYRALKDFFVHIDYPERIVSRDERARARARDGNGARARQREYTQRFAF